MNTVQQRVRNLENRNLQLQQMVMDTNARSSSAYILQSTINANSILYAVSDNTPAALSLAANTFPARASTGDILAKPISDFGLSLVDDANDTAARNTLGLGSMATAAAADYIANALLTTRGDLIRRGASAPERYGLVAPASPTLNFLGVANGETDPSWKSASSNPGAAASVLQTNASGYAQILRLGLGIAPSYDLHIQSAASLLAAWIRSESTTGTSTFVTQNDNNSAFCQFLTFGSAYAGTRLGSLTAASLNEFAAKGKLVIYSNNDALYFGTNGVLRAALTTAGNLKIAGTADRATTEGTNHLDIFDGTAPVGTLANGCSIYSTTGELRVMDAAGNATLISPHDDDGHWIFDSMDTVTGRRLLIDVEKMLRAINERFGWDFVKEFAGA